MGILGLKRNWEQAFTVVLEREWNTKEQRQDNGGAMGHALGEGEAWESQSEEGWTLFYLGW